VPPHALSTAFFRVRRRNPCAWLRGLLAEDKATAAGAAVGSDIAALAEALGAKLAAKKELLASATAAVAAAASSWPRCPECT